jgi:RNAse (barnase) inhibitor barstar
MRSLEDMIKNQNFSIAGNSTRLGSDFKILQGGTMLNKQDGLREIQRVFKLPDGMGVNYDSLDECLQPDFWPELKKMNIYIKNAEIFLTQSDASFVEMIVTLLHEAQTEWQKERGESTFNVIFGMDPKVSDTQAK